MELSTGAPDRNVASQVSSVRPFEQQQKLVASDGDAEDIFGIAVSLSNDGTTALVGASGDEDPNGERSGSAYVFTRDGGSWSQQQKLTPENGTERGDFGIAVALSADGTTALVGARNDNNEKGEGAGSAYIFTRTGGQWRQQATLVGDAVGSYHAFGGSVALSDDGSTAVVGSISRSDDPKAYVFTGEGGGWRQQHSFMLLHDVDAGMHWTVSVSGDGDTVLVGAVVHGGTNAVHIFVRGDSGWTKQERLTVAESDLTLGFGDAMSVSRDGTTALIGSNNAPSEGGSGSAYLFTRNGETWMRQAQFTPTESGDKTQFGISVSLSSDGTVALVTTTGEGQYVFSPGDTGWTRREVFSTDSSDPKSFGVSGSLSGDGTRTLIGAGGDDEPNGEDSGSAYVFAGDESDDDNNAERPDTTPDTPKALKTRLRDGNVLATVTIENQDYYVLNQLPDESVDTYAFVTENYELLEPQRAADVAISYEYCQSYIIDYQQRLDDTNQQYNMWNDAEQLARTANMLTQLSGIIALGAITPTAAIGQVAELGFTTIDWATEDANRPYYEAFSNIGATCSTVEWVDSQVSDPSESLDSASDSALDIAQSSVNVALTIDETIDGIASIKQGASTVLDVYRQADSITTSVDPSAVSGASALKSAGFTVLGSLALSLAVNEVSNVAEEQAEMAAIGKAGAAARRPLVHELLGLETLANNYNIGPAGIIKMQAIRQADYQIEAAATYGVSSVYQGLSDDNLGKVYDRTLGAQRRADNFEDTASTWENLSQYTAVATGKTFTRGLDDFRSSLNYDEYGTQPLLEYQ